jgi:protein-S-isoprenylcysteine O-methyltransferase Ste14
MFSNFPPSPLQLGLTALALVLFTAAFIEKRLRTGGARQAPGRRSRLSLHGIALQALAFGAGGTGPIAPTAGSLDPVSLCLALIVAVAGFGGAFLFRASAKALGDNWSLVARTRAEHTLVTSGPFSRVRHPIYLAMALLLIAVAIGFGHISALLLSIPLFVAGTAIRIREEERLLIRQFGASYRAYALRTPAFIPKLF